MGFKLTTEDYINYFAQTKNVIDAAKDYVTELDATTGDGDHWANCIMGFEKICEKADTMRGQSLSAMFKTVSMTMFSAVGGSSGALYGSGYMAASKAAEGKEYLDVQSLYEVYSAMLAEIMRRGKTGAGQKTMIDSLYQGLEAYKAALDAGDDEKTVIEKFVQGAKDGAEATRDMEAVKGRASYRTDKGVGHLDPGAVTMSMQIECMGKYISEK